MRRIMWTPLLLLAVLILVPWQSAEAVAGECEWSGTSPDLEACVTADDEAMLQDCLTEAQSDNAHNTIKVEQGTYIGYFPYYGNEYYGLSLIGGYEPGYGCDENKRVADPTQTTLDGDGGLVLNLRSKNSYEDDTKNPYLHVEGFLIKNGGGGAGCVKMFPFWGTADFIGNIVNNCTGTPLWINSGESGYGGDINVVNNIIHGNSNGQGGNTGYFATHFGALSVLNNTFAYNTNPNPGDQFGGIDVELGREKEIDGKTYCAASVDITNNIFWGNEDVCNAAYINPNHWGTLGTAPSIHIYNNDVSDLSNDFCLPGGPIDPDDYGSGNMSADPVFVDDQNGDYHLQSTSDLIDAGTDDIECHPGLPDFDIDGEERPGILYTDIGADEYWPTVAAPAWLWNPDTSVTDMVSTDWADSATPGVTYELYEATLSDYSDEQLAYSGTTSAVVLTNRSPDTYYYRVKAIKDGYYDSDWAYGTAGGCEVLQPSPAPSFLWVQAASTTGTIPTDWGDVSGATYQLYEATDPGFADASIVYEGTTSQTTLYNRTNGTYYYRVRAIQTGKGYSAWVDAPDNTCTVTLTVSDIAWLWNPASNQSGYYTVDWGDSNSGVTYELEEDTDPAFSNPQLIYSGSSSIYTITDQTNGTYYYRVRATKPGWITSNWTTYSTGCAVYLKVSAPTWIYVQANSSTGTIPTDWGNSSTSGVTYELYEATQSDFSDESLAYSGTESAATLTGRSNGTYYYRVKAVKTGYADSDWMEGANPCEVNIP